MRKKKEKMEKREKIENEMEKREITKTQIKESNVYIRDQRKQEK